MAKYIDNTNLGYLISKIKAAFWHREDVVNLDAIDVDLADVALTGDYNDLINKPPSGDTPTQHKLYILGGIVSGTVQEALANLLLDDSTPTLSDLMNLDWRNTLVDADMETPDGQGDLILHYHTYNEGVQAVEIRGGCINNGWGVTWTIFITTEMDGDLPLCRVEVNWP